MRTGDLTGAIDADLRAIVTIGGQLAGTGKPFVGTSGTLMLVFGGVQGVGTEADAFDAGPRIDAENAVIALGGRGVRSSVVRLPPTVHSSLDHTGYIPTLIAIARGKGFAAMSEMGPIAGLLDTRSTRHACTVWRSKQRRPDRGYTPSATKASPSARSPGQSGATWTFRS